MRWIKKAIGYTGDETQIVVMGQSMGGATAMMVSGLKLPEQVKAFIEDCGYSSVKEEVEYQAGNLFDLPKVIRKPLIKTMSGINRIENGFFLKRASSDKQLRKNTRPFLFIHGGKDHYVPTEMVHQNYAATNAPKFLWIAPLAGHAMSYPMYKNKYRQVIKDFLKNIFVNHCKRLHKRI
ncbi:alpha/beta hydrolase [Lactobacillus helveticus]|uniref:alpha/beta hydrolase n=1 Tax=Lactobacillus helveticus TaxID=1587 RepID=UPI000AB764E5|nr:alpha/beta hydrolase [Lactobacillus helveticus]